MKVLGIDPGSRLLGFGVVSKAGTQFTYHGCGTLRFNTKLDSNQRLVEIEAGIVTLLEKYKPDHVAIEKVFFAKNVVSALKLGSARGVAMLPVLRKNIPLFEYSPNAIKQAVVGFGHADKEQVAKMVSLLLGIKNFETADSSDALAIAICHIHSYIFESKTEKSTEKKNSLEMLRKAFR